MKINSHNEWDKLREVVLGSADKQSAVLTWDRKDPIPLKNLEKAQSLSKEAYPQWLLDEVNEDLEEVRKDRHLLSGGFQTNSTNSAGQMLDEAKE